MRSRLDKYFIAAEFKPFFMTSKNYVEQFYYVTITIPSPTSYYRPATTHRPPKQPPIVLTVLTVHHRSFTVAVPHRSRPLPLEGNSGGGVTVKGRWGTVRTMLRLWVDGSRTFENGRITNGIFLITFVINILFYEQAYACNKNFF